MFIGVHIVTYMVLTIIMQENVYQNQTKKTVVKTMGQIISFVTTVKFY